MVMHFTAYKSLGFSQRVVVAIGLFLGELRRLVVKQFGAGVNRKGPNSVGVAVTASRSTVVCEVTDVCWDG